MEKRLKNLKIPQPKTLKPYFIKLMRRETVFTDQEWETLLGVYEEKISIRDAARMLNCSYEQIRLMGWPVLKLLKARKLYTLPSKNPS